MPPVPSPHRRPDRPPLARRIGRALLAAVAVLAVIATAAPAQAAPAPTHHPRGAFDTSPAAAAVRRLIGAKASQVTLRAVDRGTAKDTFGIDAQHGRLVISGTSPAVLLTGFGWYLKYVAHVDVSLEGDSLAALPRRLPLPGEPITHTSSVTHRFALNDTNEGYAGPYLSWNEWQHRIDVLALRGINEVLLYEGSESVYQQTFEQFGYSANEMRNWIPQPGHQSWWLLQNLSGVGDPISQHLIDQRAKLGRRIADRLRSLGMTPVLPGYFGTVPDGFADRNAGAKTVPQGTWNSLPRPDWLDPTNEWFGKVAKAFYTAQTRLLGPSTMYKMDLLHEGGKAGDVDVPAASKAVQQALNAAHPDALWGILGWESNPLPATLQSIDRSKMVVLDGISDQPSVTDRDKDFFGTPYAFGTIWNFGGHTNLGAQLTTWNEKFYQWQDKPGSAQDGIALMPEAIDNNPAAVEFFTELPWRSGPVDLHDWFAQYATARYGGSDPHAAAAWRTLADTVYSWPATVDSRHPTALFDNQPSLSTSSSPLPYDTAAFDTVLTDLLAVPASLRTTSAYRYDLVDVARQVLANHSRTALPRILAAYRSGDKAEFDRLSGRFEDQIALMDRLLGSDEHFLFGSWQQGAERPAAGPAERAALRYDVRSLVTLWATGTTLQDYARREFNGLVGDYYGLRWKTYFDSLDTALSTGKPPVPVDWTTVAQDWAHADTEYPTRPHGDAYQLASEVAASPDGTLSLGSTHNAAKPGGTVSVTATFTNLNMLQGTGKLALELSTPDGYAATASTPSDADDVAAGGTFEATWSVTLPAGATAGDIGDLAATAQWGTDGHASAGTSVLVAGEVSDDWKTVDTTDASYAQSGDTIAIAGGGEDINSTATEFASVYRPGALTDGTAATTTVTRLDAQAPYARAGLIASSDLTKPGTGFAAVAVTPQQGCLFNWDPDGDGLLNKVSEVGGFGASVQVRLGRHGDTFVGECSSDGTHWTVIGSAELPGATDAEDVGMFFTAVDRHTGTAGLGVFDAMSTGTFTMPRDGSGDPQCSVGKPVTAFNEEKGHPATAANDGSRANSPYWGGPLEADGTWWQVDLGAATDVSRINVRNYVGGGRYYTYRVVASEDGTHWFTVGGRMTTAAATDAGDTFDTIGTARYVRIIGLSNTANATFHLTEVTVYGIPAS
ncbi:hypothetical protein NUM_26890 [Actinocatenispora comari]|uniref:F5/8 type C domain-containing protein n=1 Tax=Actinocatenispora comari TaxID=2807577 RepID=A0A8J4AB14_9ACTN|nr:hypothetical protein NUM_26890 [Actinocatenispora comari]